MIRFSIREQVLNFALMMLVQIPLLYDLHIGDSAFSFFYVGFLLFLPTVLSRSYSMIIAFFCGLCIDTFSNTPGIHASACVLLMYVRDNWLFFIVDRSDDLVSVNVNELGLLKSIYFLFPLIILHHVTIFIIENGGLTQFVNLLARIFYSSLFTWSMVCILNFVISIKSKKL
ncbi:MAG: hypothetical protein AAF789_01670 [Bacteroidota bacterium]